MNYKSNGNSKVTGIIQFRDESYQLIEQQQMHSLLSNFLKFIRQGQILTINAFSSGYWMPTYSNGVPTYLRQYTSFADGGNYCNSMIMLGTGSKSKTFDMYSISGQIPSSSVTWTAPSTILSEPINDTRSINVVKRFYNNTTNSIMVTQLAQCRATLNPNNYYITSYDQISFEFQPDTYVYFGIKLSVYGYDFSRFFIMNLANKLGSSTTPVGINVLTGASVTTGDARSIESGVNNVNYGLVIGTGSTANSYSTYKLDYKIPTTTCSCTATVVNSPLTNNKGLSITRQFLNITTQDITVREIALYQNVYKSAAIYVLLYRKVLDEAVLLHPQDIFFANMQFVVEF